jgi:hypothetical protein
MTLALHQICPIHPRSGHLNQHFSNAWPGHLGLAHLQHFRSAKSGEFDRSHASSIAADMCGTRASDRYDRLGANDKAQRAGVNLDA